MERDLNKADWAVELMLARQSVRSFSSEPIPTETLDKILAAGINAATGGNLQPYSIIVEKDPARSAQLAEICGKQPFIAQAPVNLIFVLDFHKLAMYAHANDAPFTAHKSLRHYTIAMEDLVCAAQSIETAAWLYGIGSCYVGTIIDSIPLCAEMYQVPKLAAPMLVLSLGYPKGLSAQRKKLAADMVIFEGTYPQFSYDQIDAAYAKKYAGLHAALPKDAKRRQAFLETFKQALLTTYTPEKVAEILQDADESGSINEIQRRFGTHYHAAEMLSPDLIDGLASQGIYPFHMW